MRLSDKQLEMLLMHYANDAQSSVPLLVGEVRKLRALLLAAEDGGGHPPEVLQEITAIRADAKEARGE